VSVSTPTFVARFGTDGQLAWVRTLGANDADAALMADGGVVVVGDFSGSKAVFEGGSVPDVSLAAEWVDLFVGSYSSTGDLRWIKTVTGVPQVAPEATTVLASGDIIVAATCEPHTEGAKPPENEAVFGPGEEKETRIACTDFDLVYARYASDGKLVWAKSIPPLSPEPRGLAPLADGGFVMASTFRKKDAPAVFDGASCGSLSLTRFSSNTDLVISWHRPDGSARSARIVATGWPRLLGISELADESVAFTGTFSDTTTFGPLDGTKVSFTTTTVQNTFLARLKP
jgi:hypothetical protein